MKSHDKPRSTSASTSATKIRVPLNVACRQIFDRPRCIGPVRRVRSHVGIMALAVLHAGTKRHGIPSRRFGRHSCLPASFVRHRESMESPMQPCPCCPERISTLVRHNGVGYAAPYVCGMEWGAHAPSRVPTGASPVGTLLKLSHSPVTPPGARNWSARAPTKAREGACAPRLC